MADVEAYRFVALTGGILSPDRRDFLLRLDDANGRQLVLSLPIEELPRLLHLADSLVCQDAAGHRDASRTVFGAHRTEIAMSEDQRLTVLTLFGQSGAPFRFAMSHEIAHDLGAQIWGTTTGPGGLNN